MSPANSLFRSFTNGTVSLFRIPEYSVLQIRKVVDIKFDCINFGRIFALGCPLIEKKNNYVIKS